MAINVKNTIGNGGGLKTVLPREGLDIGPAPDFWGDLNKIQRRFKPRANDQAQALRQGPTFDDRLQKKEPEYDLEPEYATMIGQGPNSSGVAYQSWQPGMAFSPGSQPVQTGTRRVPRGQAQKFGLGF